MFCSADRPITYLYNTLHFYERKLRDRPPLKKLLVKSIINSLASIRPPNWAVSEQYQAYIEVPDTEVTSWQPELTYYISLLRRLVESKSGMDHLRNGKERVIVCFFFNSQAINGQKLFYLTDWRFNEFPNAAAHALYITCVELLSLPVGPQGIANNLIDAIVKGYTVIPSNQIHSWINAVGVLMAALPEPYWSVIYDRLQEILTTTKMTEWSYRHSPFEMFNFKTVKEAMLDRTYVLLMAIAQSILHHSSIGQLTTLAE